MKIALPLACTLLLFSPSLAQDREPAAGHLHGVGHVHLETSCSPSVAADFDRALALLHNFWYGRALEAFDQIIRTDSECAMAYWGAA
ncbi:MAG TPA: hypothetical protein VJ302_01390, partial [Blastocatellia bacterium]|nr:hypothetical protein [Blastocatellia bacterium]